MTNTTYPQAGKFIDPLSDWGFRHYFGSEPNKEILIEFLNDLFEGEKYIEDLEYGPTEHDGDDDEDRRVIFDLHCKGTNGEFFIIEMQRIRQEYFKDRALYYTSRLIQRQLPKGKAFNNLGACASEVIMASGSKRKDDLGIRWAEESCEEAKGAVGKVERLHRIV